MNNDTKYFRVIGQSTQAASHVAAVEQAFFHMVGHADAVVVKDCNEYEIEALSVIPHGSEHTSYTAVIIGKFPLREQEKRVENIDTYKENEPSPEEVLDACLSYRHDFGLMAKQQQEVIKNDAKAWLQAWQKTNVYGRLKPNPSIKNVESKKIDKTSIKEVIEELSRHKVGMSEEEEKILNNIVKWCEEWEKSRISLAEKPTAFGLVCALHQQRYSNLRPRISHLRVWDETREYLSNWLAARDCNKV
jgi:hypothetical protein